MCYRKNCIDIAFHLAIIRFHPIVLMLYTSTTTIIIKPVFPHMNELDTNHLCPRLNFIQFNATPHQRGHNIAATCPAISHSYLHISEITSSTVCWFSNLWCTTLLKPASCQHSIPYVIDRGMIYMFIIRSLKKKYICSLYNNVWLEGRI